MKHCGCRNHRGTPKGMHKSRENALAQVLTPRYMNGLPHEVYPCPRKDGVFHIRTKKK